MIFSEYALDDILKSGIYNNDDELEIEFRKKGSRKQRPKNPFHSSATSIHDTENDADIETDDTLDDDDNDDQFQKLYDDLQKSKIDSDCYGGQFEEIYENLNIEMDEEVHTTTSGSFLPPEIYDLHTEGHSQRMGILSRYVETSNYSLGDTAGRDA